MDDSFLSPYRPPPTYIIYPPTLATPQAKAEELGACLRQRFLELADTHPLVGDVRGLGMMLGIELVTDRCVRWVGC